MKATTIDLLRHGEVVGEPRLLGHLDDPPLSDRGWTQMRSLLVIVQPPLPHLTRVGIWGLPSSNPPSPPFNKGGLGGFPKGGEGEFLDPKGMHILHTYPSEPPPSHPLPPEEGEFCEGASRQRRSGAHFKVPSPLMGEGEGGGAERLPLLNGARPPWQRIITSPLKRCAAFAGEIADRYGLSLTYEHRFQEIGLGDWEGKLFPELYKNEGDRMRRFLNNPLEASVPGGEIYQAFEERVWQAWDELLEAHQGQHCLVVMHGGTIRVILRQVLGLPVGGLFRIEVPHACLSRIRKDEDGPARLVFHGGVL